MHSNEKQKRQSILLPCPHDLGDLISVTLYYDRLYEDTDNNLKAIFSRSPKRSNDSGWCGRAAENNEISVIPETI